VANSAKKRLVDEMQSWLLRASESLEIAFSTEKRHVDELQS